MQLYIYAKSGHSFGLENIRRASAIYDMLKNSDPVLCTADYRAATFAKYNLKAPKGVGVDVIGNLPHVMERGDILIFDDSNEASQTMQTHMRDFCTHLYKVGEEIPFDIVDSDYFETTEKTIEKTIFFADDDYQNWFYDFCNDSKKHDMALILGHYFFLGNEDRLEKSFNKVYEDEDYKDILTASKYVLTASVHTTLEVNASGGKPVYFKRKDKETIENFDLIEKYNIPVVEADDLDKLIEKFEETISNYPTIKRIEKFDISPIKTQIEETLKKFDFLKPSLEYKY